jgi:hypothetical protein
VAKLGVKWTVLFGAVPYLCFLLATEGVLSTIGTASPPGGEDIGAPP